MKAAALIITLALATVLIASAMWLYTPDKSRSLLEARYLETPADYVEVNGLRMHVRDSGSKEAPTVVMLHGFGSSLHTWEPWSQALASTHRVVRLDLPGFGLTGPDPTGDYTDPRSLQVLAALMDRLAVKRASLIGNSIGGRIAWKFAAQNPERVDKLVLISSDGFAGPGVEYGRQQTVPFSIKLMRYILPTPLVRMSLAPAYGNPSLLTEAVVERYRDLMLAPGVRQAMIMRMEQTVYTDPEPLLRQIQAPTLLLWGELDAMIPFSNAADYARLISGSSVVSLPGLGRVPQEEAPDVSHQPVQAFLK